MPQTIDNYGYVYVLIKSFLLGLIKIGKILETIIDSV